MKNKLLLLLTSLLMVCVLKAQVQEKKHIDFKRNLIDCGIHLYRWVFATEGGDVITYKMTHVCETKRISAIAFHPAGSYFVTGNGKNFEIEVWLPTKENTQIKTFKGHAAKINTFVFSNDGEYLLSGDDDNSIKIWDLRYNNSHRSLNNNGKPVHAIAISPNRHFFATDCGNEVLIWNFNNSKQLNKLSGHRGGINTLKFSSNGKFLASAGKDSTILLWDTKTWEIIKRLEGQNEMITTLDLHKDTKYLAAGSISGSVLIWNLKKNRIEQIIDNHKNRIKNISFFHDYDKDESFLLTFDKNCFYVWAIDQLQPSYETLVNQKVDDTIELWSKKYENETSDDYSKRINDSTRIAYYDEIRSKIITEYALQKHNLQNPENNGYVNEKESFILTFKDLKPIHLHIPRDQKAKFESNYADFEYYNPKFDLDENDDFYLKYLDVKNLTDGELYTYDASNIKKKETEIKFVPV